MSLKSYLAMITSLTQYHYLVNKFLGSEKISENMSHVTVTITMISLTTIHPYDIIKGFISDI